MNWKKLLLFFSLFIFVWCSQTQEVTVENNSQTMKNNIYQVIANIPEASGICILESKNTFVVANDEGKIYEVDTQGNIVTQKNIGDYDFEWIICNNQTKEIYLLIENTGNILPVSIENFEKKEEIILDISKKERKKYFNSKSWAEWLAINGNTVYISTQNDKNNLLEFELSQDLTELKLQKVYDVDSHDLSGMTYYKNNLYILSDKNDEIYIYDLEKEKIIETISLEKWNWEWIVFDNNGQLYLADDAGSIVKYNLEK